MPHLKGWRWMALAAASLVILPLVGLRIGAAVNANTPELYKATSTVRVFNPYRVSGSDFGQVDVVSIVGLEARYAKSAAIKESAKRKLEAAGVTYDHAVWVPLPTEGALTINCYAKVATAARDCADTYAKVFVENRATQAGKSLQQNADQSDARIKALQRQYDDQQVVIEALDSNPARQNTVRAALQRQASLLSRINALTVTGSDVRDQAEVVAANYEIADPAEVPESLAQPLTTRNLAAGVVAGFLLALAVAALIRPRNKPRSQGDADLA